MKKNLRSLNAIFIVLNLIIYTGLTFNLTKKEPVAVGSVKKEKTVNITKPNLALEIVDPPRGNHFPYGQCTWYVATKRNVPWNGNAGDWYANSQKFGRKVGNIPKQGAILVTREGPVGHVAYVEKVISSQILITEMNNPFWGRVTTRQLNPQSLPVIGYIY